MLRCPLPIAENSENFGGMQLTNLQYWRRILTAISRQQIADTVDARVSSRMVWRRYA